MARAESEPGMKVDLYHNIRWSRYKARVFSALHKLATSESADVRFFQIADTDGQRTVLSGVELEYHQYPHELLFPGSYGDIPASRLMATLFRKVMKSDAELVLMPGFDRPEYWAMLLAAILSGKKRGTFCDSTLHDRPQSAVKGLLKRLFFGLCNGVFCYGQRARNYLLHYGMKPERIHQRYQAAALPSDYCVDVMRETRLRMAQMPAEPQFLYVGRLSPEKSLDVLLLAFAQVLSALPAARLVLVGGGPQADELKALAGELGLGDAVIFAGSMGQETLAEQYARATCLVLPSRSEPWGLVVNEALHYGCPVIVSDHCGCVPELVIDGKSGYVFQTDNAGDLSNKMLKLITELGDVAQATDNCLQVIAPYSPDATARQILAGSRAILSIEGAR